MSTERPRARAGRSGPAQRVAAAERGERAEGAEQAPGPAGAERTAGPEAGEWGLQVAAAEPGERAEGAGEAAVAEGAEGGEQAAGAERAAAEALARARAVARAKGLRPGSRGAGREFWSPRRYAGSAPDARDPATLGNQVDRLLTERGWGADVSAGAVMARWPAIVGPDVAAHCAPVTFADGVLTVRAESTAWATNLRLLEATLTGRIEAEVGPGVVAELRVVGPSAPSWSRGPRRTDGGRGPRDTYG
ncbi:MAG TPA: DciA family protein [Dermatophilaceae bacterium]|nr:DciA family protein [Dermatophilaceae bacterium]